MKALKKKGHRYKKDVASTAVFAPQIPISRPSHPHLIFLLFHLLPPLRPPHYPPQWSSSWRLLPLPPLSPRPLSPRPLLRSVMLTLTALPLASSGESLSACCSPGDGRLQLYRWMFPNTSHFPFLVFFSSSFFSFMKPPLHWNLARKLQGRNLCKYLLFHARPSIHPSQCIVFLCLNVSLKCMLETNCSFLIGQRWNTHIHWYH